MAIAICAMAALTPAVARAATIEGVVTPLAWDQEVEVCLVEAAPSETCTIPGMDGSYALEGVPAGTVVAVEFVPSYRSRLVTQYWDGKNRLSEATPIKVPAKSGPETPVVGNINADLGEGGAIKGVVTAASNAEHLAEVEVCAISNASPTVRICDETGLDGEYELHSLPLGSYEVGFWGTGKSGEYEPWYYQGKSSLAQATPIPVNPGETIAGIDGTLVKGGRISGVVTAAAGGMPLEGIAVCLFMVSGATAQRCEESGDGGAYSFQGLPGGSYQVGFSLGSAEIGGRGTTEEVDGFEPQYYDDVAARAQAATISLLAPGIVEGVDAALAAPSALPSPSPVSMAATPIVAAAPVVPEPEPRKLTCKRPKQKKKVNGRSRCVKSTKHRKPHKHKRRKA